MIPIYEQGGGRGIGLGIGSFLDRFEEICTEHLKNKRAKAFALILYNFNDDELKQILRDTGAFARIDRISGDELSVFYLHGGSEKAFQQFNETLINALELESNIQTPCVVFFRLDVKSQCFTDTAVAQLDSTDLIHGLGELSEVIEEYRDKSLDIGEQKRVSLSWVRSGGKFVTIEMIRAALRELLEKLYFS